MEAREGRTIEALLPWGHTPLRRGLATRDVIPGAQTGYTRVFNPDDGLRFIGPPGTPHTVRCDTYLDAVEARAQRWLAELKSPNGTPMGQVFEEELGMDAIQQARFLVYREMIRVGEAPAPAPSLAGQYGVLRGLGAAGAALGGASQGPKGAALAGLGSELKRSVESVSWFVGWGVFLTWWGPYIVGLVNLVLLGLFPIVLLWALIPGTQFQPLAQYFVALLFTNSMPLWWALVDVAARLASANAPRSTDLLGGLLGNSLTAMAWSTAVTVLGILLVPVVTGILMFAVFRTIGGLWRGGV